MLPKNLLTKYGTMLFLYFQIHQFQSIPDNDSQLLLHQFVFLKPRNQIISSQQQVKITSVFRSAGEEPPEFSKCFSFCNLGVCKHH